MPVTIKQNADGSMSLHDEAAGRAALKVGGPAAASAAAPRFEGEQVMKIALGSADAAAGVLSWQNTFGYDILVSRFIVDLTTIATGACTVDFGQAATAISNDTLIDGLDTHSATGLFDNLINHGTDGLAMVKVPAGNFITGSKASGAAAGMVGSVRIHYTAV